jgi:hypothetical protein
MPKNTSRWSAFWKTLAILVCGAVALIPFWFWLLCYAVLSPDGFWQKLVVYGVGLYFLGVIQFVLLVIFIVVALYIIVDRPW